jgi:hypothetical protein
VDVKSNNCHLFRHFVFSRMGMRGESGADYKKNAAGPAEHGQSHLLAVFLSGAGTKQQHSLPER